MAISSLEQQLAEQKQSGNLTRETIATALQNGQYIYDIRDPLLKREIYSILMAGCADTTTMYVD